jgi:hypothetical protein
MLIITMKAESFVCKDLANDTLNVSAVDLFAKGVNTYVLESAYNVAHCNLDRLADDDDRREKWESIKELATAILFKGGADLVQVNGKADADGNKPVKRAECYNSISAIPGDIRTQCKLYASTLINLAVGTTVKNHKIVPITTAMPRWDEVWERSKAYYVGGCHEEELVVAVQSIMNDVANHFKTDAPTEHLRKWEYHCKRKVARTIMNCAAELLNRNSSTGNVGYKDLGKKKVSQQMALAMFNIKEHTSKKVNTVESMF